MSRMMKELEDMANDLNLKETKAYIKRLKVEEMNAKQIVKLRKREKVSQLDMAVTLNVALSTYQKWEQNRTHPSGPALKLLNLVQKNGLSAIS